MKKTTTILLLIFLSNTFLFAQNWQPINKNFTYHFQIDTADYISNTIKVDSVKIIDTDSVFYLNRIVTDCDTCSNNGYIQYAVYNQPQFLMRKMIKKSEALYIFSDTSEFSIKPFLHFGDTWTFDTENNVNAVISFEGIANIFNTTDSVKQINLSSGGSIIISKNNGIIKFPFDANHSYDLIGEEKGSEILGEKMPTFMDFFDYEVGDVFQRLWYSYNFPEGISEDETVKKYTILSKEIRNDSIIYQIEGWKLHTIFEEYSPSDNDTSAYQFSETLVYVDSVNHFANRFNQELHSMGVNPNLPGFSDYYESEVLDKTVFLKEDGRNVKKFGDFHFGYFSYSTTNYELLEIQPYEEVTITYNYTEGLGESIDMMYFEWADGDLFMGKVHNGDTIGTIYDDAEFEQYIVDVNKINKQKISIYPNPIKQGQNLQINSDAKIKTYSIYNISGQKILTNKFSNSINTSTLPAGIYILELNSENKIYREKILVK